MLLFIIAIVLLFVALGEYNNYELYKEIKENQITLMNYNTERVICDYDRVNVKYQQYYEMGYFDGLNSTFDERYRKCLTVNGIIAYIPYPMGCEEESDGVLMDHDKFWSDEEW